MLCCVVASPFEHAHSRPVVHLTSLTLILIISLLGHGRCEQAEAGGCFYLLQSAAAAIHRCSRIKKTKQTKKPPHLITRSCLARFLLGAASHPFFSTVYSRVFIFNVFIMQVW